MHSDLSIPLRLIDRTSGMSTSTEPIPTVLECPVTHSSLGLAVASLIKLSTPYHYTVIWYRLIITFMINGCWQALIVKRTLQRCSTYS